MRKRFNALDRFIRSLRARRVLRQIPAGSRVLDVGCGQDNWFVRGQQHFAPTSLGIDPHLRDEVLDHQASPVELDQVVADDPAGFDVVTGLAMIEHVDPVDADALVTSMRRALRPGGRLVLTTPSPRAKPMLEFLAYRLKVISEDEIRDHRIYYSKETLRQLVERNGFRSVRLDAFQFGLNLLVVGHTPPET